MNILSSLRRCARGRRVRALCLWFNALLGALAVAPALSGATVRDLENRTWLKVSTPDLLIVSDASPEQVRTWVGNILVFRRALRQTCPLPEYRESDRSTLFLFKSESALRPFLPDIDGKRSRLEGFFGRVLGHEVGAISLAGSRFSARERIYHELVHWYLRRSGVNLPLWLEEGLAQVYESFILEGDQLMLGKAVRQQQIDHVRIAGTPPLAPLLETAQLDFSRASFKHGRTDLFYAQSWALADLLLFASPDNGLASVGRYVAALGAGMTGEKAFVAGFGLTLAEARDRLDLHLRTQRSVPLRAPFDRKVQEEFAIEPMAQAEMEARAALLLIAGGYQEAASQLIARRLPDAPIDPFLHELVAAQNLGAEEPSSALIRALAEAYRHGTRNPLVPALLGQIAVERNLRAETGRDAFGLFQAALELSPGLDAAHAGMARLVLSRDEFTPAMRTGIAAALVRAPHEPMLNVAQAHMDALDGKKAEAAARFRRVLDEHSNLPQELRFQINAALQRAQEG